MSPWAAARRRWRSRAWWSRSGWRAANVIDGVSSLYWWQGTLEQAAETVVVLKTRGALLPALAARIRELHSYDCPAIVALPVAGAMPTICAGSRTRPGLSTTLALRAAV